MTPLTTPRAIGYTYLEDPVAYNIEQKFTDYEKWLYTAHRLGSITLNIFIALPLICIAGPALPILLPGIVCSLITIQYIVNAPGILSVVPATIMGLLSCAALGGAIKTYATWLKNYVIFSPFFPHIVLGSTIILGTVLCAKGICFAIEKYYSWKIHYLKELLSQISQMKSDPAYQPPPNVCESLNLWIKDLFTLPFCHGTMGFIPSIVEQLLVKINPEKI